MLTPQILTPRIISRQGEIIEVFLRHGWDYMRRLVSGSAPDEPDLPPPAVLRNILIDLGPVYIKLGQLLSTRPDLLSPAYIEALSTLQSTVPPVPAAEMEIFIRQQLAQPPEDLFAEIDYSAIAAGSIGQTHKAVLQSGQPVALKVRRPGIEIQIKRDVDLIKDIARLVATTQFGQRYNVVSLAEEFSTALFAELDFSTEASYTDRLRLSLQNSKWFDPKQLVVPQIVWSLTGPNLLVMEWLEGKPLLTAAIGEGPLLNGAETKRQAVTTLLFRAFFQQYFVNGFFHADPHPGNVFYLKDGRVALLDCGMMGSIDPQTRAALTEMVLAIVNSDAQRCTQLTLQLAEPIKPVNLVQLESDYSRLLSRYYGLNLDQINTAEAFSAILDAGTRNHLRWPANIGLFTKSLANLEGVALQFNPAVNLVEEIRPLMVDLFRQQLIGDDPLQTLLRTGLEFRNLSMSAPRQFGFLLDRLSDETLSWNVNIQSLSSVQRSIEQAANRRAFSTVVAALIIGAAIISTGQQTSQLQWLSNSLFAAATLLGIWLIISILRSGRWR
ncbi:AarF/ABC1/UbiB kinase family protein [Romeria aff. gracilis LEGE 07310]|uniref:AarF/ABC1/UbiB kinase family protein n=1 Tax=Vasconcelosia minhoensis LEGE 07310 TaxID=915328 RepID=A0A8J7AAS4_9CYAN|nr:AarF/ABC1/UbiB kinase family protein [Romeria gracilis]MBE9076049.1 AarF/ABC1/UbiB kinase family protein [Romeria aff. gracilis LEGE 07310]